MATNQLVPKLVSTLSLASQPGTNPPSGQEKKTEGTELRAKFSDINQSGTLQTSPLLSSTPPIVAKSLIKSYPYLLISNKILAILTWTNDDYWINLIVLCLYGFFVLYCEEIVTWIGHLVAVVIITFYAILNQKIIEETNENPTLDDVVQLLTTTCIKADMLLNPITSLLLNAYDIKRLLFTTVFLTPLYLVILFFIIKPRTILLVTGLYLLSYHSAYLRVTRKVLWRIKIVRLLCFYLTGLDFLTARNHSLFAAAFAKVQYVKGGVTGNSGLANDGKPVRFTYVIFENQRRWLGIGWTLNLLSYERTPWTDEFLNESSSVETFQLPDAEKSNYLFGSQQQLQLTNSGARWRWVDKTWRVDLTNDGAITLGSNKRSKTTADPLPDEGYIYYDNVWKKPSTEDTFGKYTRRRRWIRTAEMVFEGSSSGLKDEISIDDIQTPLSSSVSNTSSSSGSVSGSAGSKDSSSKSRKRKSLRFDVDEKLNEEDEDKDEKETTQTSEEAEQTKTADIQEDKEEKKD